MSFDRLVPTVLVALLLIGGGAAAALAGEAEGPVDPAAPLGLDEALRLARDHHPALEDAEAQRLRAQATRLRALSALLPTVSATGSYNRRPEEVRRSIGEIDVVLQARDALSANATAEVAVVDAAAIHDQRVARRVAGALEDDAVALERAVAFDACEALLAVRSAERQYEAAARRVALADVLVAAASARAAAGVSGQGEADRAGIEHAAARLSLIESDRLRARARLVLAEFIGVQDAMRPIANFDVPAATEGAEPVVGDDVRAARARAEAAELAKAEPGLSFAPALSLRATARLTNEAGFTGRIADGTVGAVLNWQIWDGGAREARGLDLHAAAVSARADLRAAEQDQDLAVRVARLELDAATRALVVARDRAEIARRFAAGTTLRFREGIATILEEADAATAAFDAEIELARRQLDHDLAAMALRRALGWWPT